MAQPSVHGRFIWQELVTDDMAAAGSFYSKVIGWRVRPDAHQGGNYSILATEHGGVGGVTSLPDEARLSGGRAHWLPYVGVENVDATAAKAERLGGRILHAPSDIQDAGRYAVLADPQGASFGIYRPKNPPAAGKSPATPGEVAWEELASTDFEAALRFYGDLFGWQVLRRTEMGSAGTYVVFGRGGVQQGGMYKLPAQVPTPYWLSYIEVSNTEAAADAARQAGGRVTSGPMDVPGGRVAQLLDPHGVPFAVHTASQAAAGAGTAAATATAAGTAAGTETATTAGAATADGVSGRAPRPSRAARPARPGASATGAATPATGSISAAPADTSAATVAAQKKVAKKAAPRRVARPAVQQAAKKAAKKAVKKVARKTARKAGQKAARRAGKKAAHRTARKSVRKSVRTSSRGSSRATRVKRVKRAKRATRSTRRSRGGRGGGRGR